MLRKFVLLVIAAGIVGFAAFWFITKPQAVSAAALPAHTPNLDNGKTMFNAGGCASCHATPNQDDRTKLGGGFPLKSPFGTFYVPNISSDAKDGIGGWSEAQFVTAMLKGTSPTGEHYYPAFPYSSYQRMNVADVRDLFAYLKTLPAVSGRIRDHDLPFPFNVRLAVGGWKLLYLDGRSFTPDPSQSADWNRGAYLVNGPGHCAECH
jgi:mono/diheme cytochrome c family protein